ncbi:DUF441 domain-containing protein [Peribacillus deserti]|uniref:UPF0756 membrane protein CUU66_03810 n=1 Tax=Peribacillus deserti TaxID=673318 RepID=A0A2N5MA01_9BACI|nr:DUF441 domain-containing protein [Peribacillus deserti]PLT31181.1 DUF441 domain-containing protein [Peribacillus deserti]
MSWSPVLFLFLLLGIGLIARNYSLVFSAGVLLLVKAVGLDTKIFPHLQAKGINWGVTVITISVLVPVASGSIGFKELGESLRSPYAWIALGSGIAVALIAKNGLVLLADDPHLTAALVFGTIIAVSLFKGVAVGPLIGAGIAYMCMRFIELFK